MGRQVPKNVRQIGNVSDSSKIYIEDYVDIFLNQLCDKEGEGVRAAFLVGEVLETEENDYVYVSGAIHMKNLVVKGKELIIEENVWQQACEVCKEYFVDLEILGWCVVGQEMISEMNFNIRKMHQKYFTRENSIFLFKNKREKDEKLFIYKFKEMMELKGHYVFYEKNEAMQSYMIACRKNEEGMPSEAIDDQAAKTFRSMIQDKLEHKEEKGKLRLAPILVMLLVAGLAVGGMEWMRRNQASEQEVEAIVQEEPESMETSGTIVAEDTVSPEEEPQIEDEIVEEVSGLQVEEVYIVNKGDTIASISTEIYGDISYISAICELNGLEDGNLIFVGQKLLLP